MPEGVPTGLRSIAAAGRWRPLAAVRGAIVDRSPEVRNPYGHLTG
jgi:hypothetical protein